MPLRPLRSVHVSTRASLDDALRKADRIVVEGNDALLAYAVGRTSGDPEAQAEMEPPVPPSPAFPGFDAPLHSFAAPPVPIPSGFENVFASAPAPMAASGGTAPSKRFPGWIIVAAMMLIVAIALGGFALRFHGSGITSDAGNPAGQVAPTPPPEADLGLPTTGLPPPTNEIGVIQAIAWPGVAVIAILALALIARQAIAAGRNVEFSWKVTERVSGRVVITRVKNPSSRRSASA